VVFFNRGSQPAASSVALSLLPGFGSGVTSASVRDVWGKTDLPKAKGGALASGSLAPHAVAFFRVTKA
jgi:hypothetical protein